MKTDVRFLVYILILLNLLAPAVVTPTVAGGRWFPQSGPAANHQRCLDVQKPAVAMVVALQPGFEDLPLLAYLRTQVGAKTAVAFLTNGEGTPGDSLSRFPLWMTGERKREADAVARLLDADAWFVNLPDVPAAGSAGNLQALWDSSSASRRLARAIRTYKPDIVVVCADRRLPDTPSLRDTVAMRLVGHAVAEAATQTDTSHSRNLLPWKVSRVFVQTRATGLPAAYRAKSPALGTSPLSIAHSAASLYRTLRLQIDGWNEEGRGYRESKSGVPTVGNVSPEALLRGMPAISQRLQSVEAAVRAAVKTDKHGIRTATLPAVSRAIDIAEYVLSTRPKDTPALDQRLLVALKNGLEDLRCSVMGVSVKAVQSESLLTESQIWFLTMDLLKPQVDTGTTEVIFPLATRSEWVINETLQYHFRLDSATQFTVLTPEDVSYTMPVSEYGLRQNTMSFTFPFVVVHKDARRERNFMYRSSLRLWMGPRRSFALRTPVVNDDTLSPVIYELQNFSRNTFKGMMSLSDTSRQSNERAVEFLRKDQVIFDTLYLPGRPADSEGHRLFTLELSGKGGKRSVTARRIVTATDTARHVGILSTLDGSPVAEALRVIHQPHELLSPEVAKVRLKRLDALIVDRDVLCDPVCTTQFRSDFAEWIRGGGHAIVFPQGRSGSSWLSSLCGSGFAPVEPLPSDAVVKVDSAGLLSLPNRYVAADWQGWVESRAFVAVRQSGTQASTPVVSSGPFVLVSTVSVGNGRVTLVAADLISQFVNYHLGAFRILANMIGS
jgi:hypothetical protein